MKAVLLALVVALAGCGGADEEPSLSPYAGTWEGTWAVSGPHGSAFGDWTISVDSGGHMEAADSEGRFGMEGSIGADGTIDVSCMTNFDSCLGWSLHEWSDRKATGTLLDVAGRLVGDIEVIDNEEFFGTLTVSVSSR